MRTRIFQKVCSAVALIVILGGLTACDNAEYDTIDNAIYISEASDDILQKVMVDETGGKASISVRTNQKSGQEIIARIGEDQNLLDEYNKTLIPQHYYKIFFLST